MKNKAVSRKILTVSLLMAIVLSLSACNLIVKDPEVDARQVIVSVNGEEVLKDRFTQYYNNAYNQEYAMQQLYQQYGMVQQISVDADAVLEDTAAAVARDLVMRQKGKELGLDAFTGSEEAEIQAAADGRFKDLLAQIKDEFFPETKLSDEELDTALRGKAAELNITMDDIVETERNSKLYEKLKEYATRQLTVSDEEIQADFDQNVENAKASYESDLSAYGNAVNGGQTVYYAPAGYRFIKQILVKLDQDDQDAISALKAEMAPLQEALDEAQAAVDAFGAEDVQEATDAETSRPSLLDLENTLNEAQANYDAKKAELTAREAAAYAAILPRANEAYAKAVAEGADFDALIDEYNDDAGQPAQGYAVFKDFTGFDEAFMKPAMALENIGDVAEPSQGIYGYYIVQYAADIPEGSVALDTVRESIHEKLLTAKQDAAFVETGDQWVAEADIKTFTDRMKD
ncbi:MAG: hypothetical protein PHN46_00635 [Eubacteriales bacterium]|jgi:peptidyl-prolyl cis-trans isomerase D|nr:hypothetical protein [Eubacteriales bacterium]NLO13085.1 hypothetical protein [Clostridiales bacterium]